MCWDMCCVMSGRYQRLLLVKDKLTLSSVEKIVDTFVVDEWTAVAKLYEAVAQFAPVYKGQWTFSPVHLIYYAPLLQCCKLVIRRVIQRAVQQHLDVSRCCGFAVGFKFCVELLYASLWIC